MKYAILVALALAGCAPSIQQRAQRDCVRAVTQEQYMDCMRFYQTQQLIEGQNAAAAAAANAALMQGSAAMLDASRPRPAFAPPTFPATTNCWRYGPNNVSCSSY